VSLVLTELPGMISERSPGVGREHAREAKGREPWRRDERGESLHQFQG
jgi:hypothetical protein